MNIPKEAIEKAIEGGWNFEEMEHDGIQPPLTFSHNESRVTKRGDEEVRCVFKDKVGDEYASWVLLKSFMYRDRQNRSALDPLFWQALGKSMGWEDADDWEPMGDEEMSSAMTAIEKKTGLEVKAPLMVPQLGPHWWFISDSWQRRAHDFYTLIHSNGDTDQFWKDIMK